MRSLRVLLLLAPLSVIGLSRPSAAAIACQAGEYPSDAICVGCTAVPNCAGAITCTGPSDSTCATCGVGYFKSAGTPTVCSACAAPCPAGQYEATACSSDGNRVCASCEATCATCTGAAATDCTSCGAGAYLSEGYCNACATCRFGMHVGVACTATSNTICVDDPDAGSVVPKPDAGGDGTEPIDSGTSAPQPFDAGPRPSLPQFDAGPLELGFTPTSDEDCAVRGPGSKAPASALSIAALAAAIAVAVRRRRSR